MSSTENAVGIDDLLTQAQWVRALAYAMVRNDADADDLAQRALLAALRSPPAELGALRGWFRTVVRNLVHEDHRTGGRRLTRESAVAVPEAHDADPRELAARVELLQEVVAAVQRLPERYKETILLRFFGGLGRAQIAAHLGVSEEAVKSRLQRALDMLRADLRRRLHLDDDDAAFALALAPLLRWPLAVPEGPASHSSRSRFVRAAGAALGLVVAALLVVAVLPHMWSSGASALPTTDSGGSGGYLEAAARTPTRDGARRIASVPLADPRTQPLHGVAEATTTARADEAPRDGGSAALVVLDGWTPDLGRVPLRLQVRHLETKKWTPSRTVVAEEGRLRLDADELADPGLRAVCLRVTTDHPECVPTTTEIAVNVGGAGAQAHVALRRAVHVRGHVVWAAVSSPDQVYVGVVRRVERPELYEAVDSCAIDVDGVFDLRADPDAAGAVIATGPTSATASVQFQRPIDVAGGSIELRLEPGATIEGRVAHRSGGPRVTRVIARADAARFAVAIGGSSAGWCDDAFWCPDRQADVAADGSFRIEGLEPGPFSLGLEGAGVALDVLNAAGRANAPARDVEIVVEGAPLIVRVLRDGRPLAFTRVRVSGDRGATSGSTDARGELLLRVHPDVPYQATVVDAEGLRYVESFRAAAPSGDPQCVELEVNAPDLHWWHVRLLDAEGAHVEEATARFTADDGRFGSSFVLRATKDPDSGALAFGPLPAGAYSVEIGAGRAVHDPTWYLEPASMRVVLPSAERAPAELALRTGGRLVLTLSDAHGGRVGIRRALARAENGLEFPLRFVQRGAGDLVNKSPLLPEPCDIVPLLPPGRYDLVLERSLGGVLTRPFEIREGASTVLVVEARD